MLCVDVGSRHCACALFLQQKLATFSLFEANNVQQVAQEMLNYSPEIFVLEQQLPCNKKATKIATWLEMFWYCKNTKFEFFASKKKYALVKLDKSVDKKKWAIQYIDEFLYCTDNKDLLQKWNKLHKKDDVADAILIGLCKNSNK